MNKIKVIDLLNMISKGEEVPKEIKYNACLFAFERQSQDYYCEEYGNLFEYLINEHRTGEFLNDEVEIIEEDKKIEKLELVSNGNPNSYALLNEYGTKCGLTKHSKIMCDKINEIIDYINGGTNGE